MDKRVTIIMTIRETYSHTIKTIESLIANTTIPYRLILFSYKIPEFILSAIAKYENVEVIESTSQYQSIARNMAVPLIDTEFTVFLDNNITVSPLWLEALIECMEENNAGIVGPLYLWYTDKIHMFGGDITIENNNFYDSHIHMNRDRSFIDSLSVRKCDYVEYHCLMVRTDLLKTVGIDTSLLTVFEYISLSFDVKQLGYDTYTTPKSVVTYVNNVDLEDYDVNFFKERWNVDVVEQDIQYFRKKWGFNEQCKGFYNLRKFVKGHLVKYLQVGKKRPTKMRMGFT